VDARGGGEVILRRAIVALARFLWPWRRRPKTAIEVAQEAQLAQMRRDATTVINRRIDAGIYRALASTQRSAE
jgi:hypothetical protein